MILTQIGNDCALLFEIILPLISFQFSQARPTSSTAMIFATISSSCFALPVKSKIASRLLRHSMLVFRKCLTSFCRAADCPTSTSYARKKVSLASRSFFRPGTTKNIRWPASWEKARTRGSGRCIGSSVSYWAIPLPIFPYSHVYACICMYE